MKTNTIRNCAIALMLVNVVLVCWIVPSVLPVKADPTTTHTLPTSVYRLILNQEVDNADGTVDVISSVVVLEIGSESITVNELD